jgi:coenzyme F420-reducing hydrogenase delta subunit/NAD-dependent dihydropyrimidine dehydrogenase PreA subunit
LNQGQKAGAKTAQMLQKSKEGQLYIPRVVCIVDPHKCVGCGQCQELCDCGGIGVDEGPGGGLPRIVDPMVCTGGGTCAAACPYHALVLQNNSNDQREARVAALSAQLAHDEVVVIGCVWGGLPAADNAGKQGLKYDSRIHVLGVPCVGQIDPCIMARALLEGAPGLILVGCLPEECHHSYGVDHAWSRVNVLKKLLTLSGFDRRRIALAHADLNKPQEFIRTVESFAQTIAMIGPIEKTPDNQEKLKSIYELIKYNTRVRHLLSASLRRPWEKMYRGEQRHALEYDRDFMEVIEEEFLQHRLLRLLESENRPLRLQDLAGSLHEDEIQVADCLWNLVSDGAIKFYHKNREAFYMNLN